jgi:hypothetical protein
MFSMWWAQQDSNLRPADKELGAPLRAKSLTYKEMFVSAHVFPDFTDISMDTT